LPLDLPEDAQIYTDSVAEDLLCEETKVPLIAARKKNSHRPHPGYVAYLAEQTRKRVETTFSIAERFAKSIHAALPREFELKVFLTVRAYAIIG